MFNFGTAEDNANLFLDGALSMKGPLLPDVHADEMSVQDLRNALAYARMAYEAALDADAADDTLDVLLDRHDAVFEALAAVDDEFRGRVLGTAPGRIIWLGGYDEDNIAKYKLLAIGAISAAAEQPEEIEEALEYGPFQTIPGKGQFAGKTSLEELSAN